MSTQTATPLVCPKCKSAIKDVHTQACFDAQKAEKEKLHKTEHTPESPAFSVGDKVEALIEMINDLTSEGMGVQHCARKGDKLIVRRVSFGYINCITVSHEHITDRAFCVSPDEINLIEASSQLPTNPTSTLTGWGFFLTEAKPLKALATLNRWALQPKPTPLLGLSTG